MLPERSFTAEVLAVRGRSIELSKDVQLKLGLELVDVRTKLVELSTVRFWKSVQTSSVKELMGLAIQAMPSLGLVVQVKESERPIRYKKKVWEIISIYTKTSKEISELVLSFIERKGNTIIPKGRRLYSKEDALGFLNLFRFNESTTDGIWSH